MSLYQIELYIVPVLENKIRLSDFKAGTFTSLTSRKSLKNAIKKGLVKINGKVGYTGDYILGGETITIYKEHTILSKPKVNITIEVLYEDNYLAIVNKPAGIVVSGNKKWTLENALEGNLKNSTQSDAIAPEPIHRLDYPTSGALLVGKTGKVITLLNKLFENREINKTYLAVTIKEMPTQGIITTRVESKVAKTTYKTIHTIPSPKYGFLNLVELKPYTGRKHQLRKHMAGMGNPIFGDLLYGEEGLILKGKGLYLHASNLNFIHPITKNPIHITAPTPKKIEKVFGKLFL